MTSIYFVRHAQPDFSHKDDMSRPLTEEGLNDSIEVTTLLKDKNIDFLISSPYKRSIDTIKNLADTLNMEINTDEDFRERKVGNGHIDDFKTYMKSQWSDFNYKLDDGESLLEVQNRNIKALTKVLKKHLGEKIVLATHGTALSTILNYYDPKYTYEYFMKIIDYMPYVIRLDFNNETFIKSTEELIIKKIYK